MAKRAQPVTANANGSGGAAGARISFSDVARAHGAMRTISKVDDGGSRKE